MATPILGICNNYSVGQIRSLKLATRNSSNEAISYPLDVVVNGTDDSTLVVSEDTTLKTMTLGSQVLKYIDIGFDDDTTEYVETLIEDRRGRYYEHRLTITVPKVTFQNNVQIKDFLFESDGEFAIANATAFITDDNDNDWIIGYDIPLVVEEFDLTSGGDDNNYNFVLVGRSYRRARLFTRQSIDFTVDPNNYDFGTLVSGATVLITLTNTSDEATLQITAADSPNLDIEPNSVTIDAGQSDTMLVTALVDNTGQRKDTIVFIGTEV